MILPGLSHLLDCGESSTIEVALLQRIYLQATRKKRKVALLSHVP